MTHKVIARIQTAEALGNTQQQAGTIVVVALLNKTGDATGFRVFMDGGLLLDGKEHADFVTARRAMKFASDTALCCIYDFEDSVTA